jgi:hypothetical protein
MVSELNTILKGKVKLEIRRLIPYKEFEYYTHQFSSNVARKARKYYDYYVLIANTFEKIIAVGAQFQIEFDLFVLLLEKKYQDIIENYGIRLFQTKDFENIRDLISPDELLLRYSDSIKLSYNVNSGSSNPENFRSGDQLSWGQKAVALLLLILDASYEVSDSRPLLMDQPEDDLDNSYIYNTLVREFRNSKRKRQIIISTHNANIPVTADAENIIVLRYDGTSGYVSDNGSLDKPSIAESVLETLEGGREAIAKREEKYHGFI